MKKKEFHKEGTYRLEDNNNLISNLLIMIHICLLMQNKQGKHHLINKSLILLTLEILCRIQDNHIMIHMHLRVRFTVRINTNNLLLSSISLNMHLCNHLKCKCHNNIPNMLIHNGKTRECIQCSNNNNNSNSNSIMMEDIKMDSLI
jgi:hypothetical protein